MRLRHPVLSLVLAFAAGSVGSAPQAEAQAASRQGGQWVAPRTEHGHPDLQGNWSNATITPIERAEGLGPFFTPEEVARMERARAARLEAATLPVDPNRPAPPAGGDGSTGAAGGTGGYDGFYIDSGDRIAHVNGEPRTSLVTMPASGRVPSLTREAQQRMLATREARRKFGEFDHPELRPLAERCIMSFGSNAGPPMLPNYFYNNNYTIVQTADHVVIMTEMINDARIIRLGEGPRLPEGVRPWMGDSWGRWEGETLVVETTNFHPLQQFRGQSSDNLRVVERLTRVDPETILYEFTLEDPTSYTEVWGGQVPFWAFEEDVLEYACHEGNHALSGILSGARYQESRETQD
jgi:hypothetical protein